MVFAARLSSCGKEGAIATPTGTPAPLTEVDVMINDYEQLANQYANVAKRLKGGDMGVTVPYIQMGESLGRMAGKASEDIGKNDTAQTQRVADISAKVAPYLQK